MPNSRADESRKLVQICSQSVSRIMSQSHSNSLSQVTLTRRLSSVPLWNQLKKKKWFRWENYKQKQKQLHLKRGCIIDSPRDLDKSNHLLSYIFYDSYRKCRQMVFPSPICGIGSHSLSIVNQLNLIFEWMWLTSFLNLYIREIETEENELS